MPTPSKNELREALQQEVFSCLERRRAGSFWPRAFRRKTGFCTDIDRTPFEALLPFLMSALLGCVLLALAACDEKFSLSAGGASIDLFARLMAWATFGALIGRMAGFFANRARPIGHDPWLRINAVLKEHPQWLPIAARWMARSGELIGRDAHALEHAHWLHQDAESRAGAEATLLKAGFSPWIARFLSGRGTMTRQRATRFAAWRLQVARERDAENAKTLQAFHEGPMAAALDAHRLNEVLPDSSGGSRPVPRERL